METRPKFTLNLEEGQEGIIHICLPLIHLTHELLKPMPSNAFLLGSIFEIKITLIIPINVCYYQGYVVL